MKKIYLLTDYQGRFGSKHNDIPYRSGMDKEKLEGYFKEGGYEAVFMNFSKVDLNDDDWKGRIVLYTSSEDPGYHYKSYIEDIVYGLELAGARVIPAFKYLRANNNKVFMETLRELLIHDTRNGLKTGKIGCMEELDPGDEKIIWPVVIKSSAGASGKGVFLANSANEL